MIFRKIFDRLRGPIYPDIEDIFVIDTETSGLVGYPEDIIFEIGICKLNIKSGEVTPIYNEILGYSEVDLTHEQQTAWIFDNSTLELKNILEAKPAVIIANEVFEILRNQYIAIYNVAYDYDKFLFHEPFNLRHKDNCVILPCIMKKSTSICKIKTPWGFGYKWPKLQEASDIILTGEELEDVKKSVDPHRAISDAFVSSKILWKLIKSHSYLRR